MHPENPTVLLVDDDRELAEMLGEFLRSDGIGVEHAFDGRNGLDRAVAGGHDAVVLDVMLPRLGGLEVLKALRERSRVPVIMLTARGEDADRILGLELGADDYLPKPFNPRELVARLRAVWRRAAPGDGADELAAGDLRLSRPQRRAWVADRPVALTGAEYAMLERLVVRAGDVVDKDALAEHALGRRLGAFDRSVDTHVSRLRAKLGELPDGGPRIIAVRGRGYQLVLPS